MAPNKKAPTGLFDLVSDYIPKGDQPEAIQGLIAELQAEKKFTTLLGATGTGKTFTIANVIQELQRPTLVMAPNKTLAAQLFQEFKDLFPHNAVHYFVSYYDYYQPEAYMPATGRFIEKDFSINDEIDKMRLASAQALLTRRDVIIVASVSCIYGLGDPQQWKTISLEIKIGDKFNRMDLLRQLIDMQYDRAATDFQRSTVRVRGDIVDIYPGYLDNAFRIDFFGEEVEAITEIDPLTGKKINDLSNCRIFPAKHFIIPEENKIAALSSIEEEMRERVQFFKKRKKYAEAQRIEQRTLYDLEMMREVGYCNGIENYSRHLDRRAPGTPPMTLIEYFPKDFLLVIDESHITVPQIGGMVEGDRSRKKNLVDFGFRLPSAFDNRPLTWDEFNARINQAVFMSATPGGFEGKHSGKVVEQIIRPTGLVDPEVEVRPTQNQIDDLLAEIRKTVEQGFRVLVTTLTKRMAENITEYFADLGLRVRYLHSEIDTIERSEIIRSLRMGEFDVLVGINLLREGLDLPEVALVGILDADKEGFLRNERSLIQTIGRASRNINGHVIMYADQETSAIKAAIKETNRRRKKQLAYNKEHNIVPATIQKAVQASLSEERSRREEEIDKFEAQLRQKLTKGDKEDLKEMMRLLEQEMMRAAQELKFEEAAMLRDKVQHLRDQLDGKVPAPEPPSQSTPLSSKAGLPKSQTESAPARGKVGLKIIPERLTVGNEFKGAFSEVPNKVKALLSWIEEKEVPPEGQIFISYLDDPRFVNPEQTRFEIFVEFNEASSMEPLEKHIKDSPYEIRVSPAGEAATVDFAGDVTEINQAYQAIFRWIQKRRYIPASHPVEIYHTSQVKQNLLKPMEIQVPVKRKPRKLEREIS